MRESYQHSYTGSPPPRPLTEAEVRSPQRLHKKVLVAALLCVAAGYLFFLNGSESDEVDPSFLANIGLWGSSHHHHDLHHHNDKKKGKKSKNYHHHHHEEETKKSTSKHHDHGGHGHDHHEKIKFVPDDETKYEVNPSLQLKGYPPLSVQEEYMKDLKNIDWLEVEKDLEELMTDSQECELAMS